MSTAISDEHIIFVRVHRFGRKRPTKTVGVFGRPFGVPPTLTLITLLTLSLFDRLTKNFHRPKRQCCPIYDKNRFVLKLERSHITIIKKTLYFARRKK